MMFLICLISKIFRCIGIRKCRCLQASGIPIPEASKEFFTFAGYWNVLRAFSIGWRMPQ